MADDKSAQPRNPLVFVLGALALAALLAWMIAGFAACKHAGLV